MFTQYHLFDPGSFDMHTILKQRYSSTIANSIICAVLLSSVHNVHFTGIFSICIQYVRKSCKYFHFAVMIG